MGKLLSMLLVFSCLLLSAQAFAAYPLATDDTGTQGMMKFQLETTAEFAWDKETEQGITTKSNNQILSAASTSGVLDSLDLIVFYPFTWQKTEDSIGNQIYNSGLNDLSLEIKWRFLEIGPTSFAIKPSITFPTGNRDRNLGAGRVGYGATLISTVEYHPLCVHVNVGYTHQKYMDIDKDVSRENLWYFSLAGTVEILTGLQLVAEVCAATNSEKADTTWPLFMTGGVIYSVIENLELSLGARGGLTAPKTDIALLTGITFKFP